MVPADVSEEVRQLMDMGFPQAQCEAAVRHSPGDVGRCIEFILVSGAAADEPAPAVVGEGGFDADGVRAPMRTGYTETLLPTEPAFHEPAHAAAPVSDEDAATLVAILDAQYSRRVDNERARNALQNADGDLQTALALLL